jgi:hypothetical protein
MFYELNTVDFFGSNPWKRSVETHEEGTFEGSVNELAQVTLWLDPSAKLADQAMISDKTSASISSLEVSNLEVSNLEASKMALSTTDSDKRAIPNVLPDG